MFNPFNQGDQVRYTGRKFARELSGKGKIGEVCSRVSNEEGAVVVDFGDDSYVLSVSSLEKWRPSAQELKEGKAEPVIETRRRRRVAEEDEE